MEENLQETCTLWCPSLCKSKLILQQYCKKTQKLNFGFHQEEVISTFPSALVQKEAITGLSVFPEHMEGAR